MVILVSFHVNWCVKVTSENFYWKLYIRSIIIVVNLIKYLKFLWQKTALEDRKPSLRKTKNGSLRKNLHTKNKACYVKYALSNCEVA